MTAEQFQTGRDLDQIVRRVAEEIMTSAASSSWSTRGAEVAVAADAYELTSEQRRTLGDRVHAAIQDAEVTVSWPTRDTDDALRHGLYEWTTFEPGARLRELIDADAAGPTTFVQPTAAELLALWAAYQEGAAGAGHCTLVDFGKWLAGVAEYASDGPCHVGW